MTEKPWASRFLWLIAGLFIILGLGYDTLTPIFEQSDETLHYPYVKHLADGQGLPLAVPDQLWNQEGTQPPLYYAIVAASTFWIDSDNLLDFLQQNPHWLFTEVRALINDNHNLVLHGPQDAWPYSHAALAIHIGRWWSLVFGLLTVLTTFCLARHLFPDNLPLGLTATALTAFNPQFLRVSATVSNDSLSAALTTLTVLVALKVTKPSYLIPRAIQRRTDILSKQDFRAEASQPLSPPPSPTGRGSKTSSYLPISPSPHFPISAAPLLLGLLCGLALLTKLSSLSTIVIVAFILFLRLFFLSELHQAPTLRLVRWLVIIGAITLALTGWWFWRNYQLYGEWLATETHLNLAGRSQLSPGDVWALRAEIGRAYWATFGWGQIRPPEWIYQLLFWFTRIGLLGLLLAFITRLAQGTKGRPLPLDVSSVDFEKILILLLWIGLNVALYVRWVMAVGSVSHSRLMFPAIAAVSLLLALGWHALLPRRGAAWFSGAVIAGLLALNLYSIGGLLYPAFRPGGGLESGKVGRLEENEASKRMGHSLDLTFLDSLKLVGGQVYPQHLGPVTPKPQRQAGQGDVVLIEAEWQIEQALDNNYSLAALLLAPDGRVLSHRETYPGLGLRPTRYLEPGQTFQDIYPLTVTQAVSEPLVARAIVSVFDLESDTRAGFPAMNSAGNEITPIIGQIKIVPTPWPVYRPENSLRVEFAQTIALIGYDLTEASSTQETASANAETPIPHKALLLTLYWESLAPVEPDYVLFLHLLDATSEVIAQADAPPTNNAYPTSWWAPGEIIADRRLLPQAPNVAAFRLGLYDLDSGQRLTITETSLPHQDNAVEIDIGD